MRSLLIAWILLVGLSAVIALGLILFKTSQPRGALLVTLLGLDFLLFMVPAIDDDTTLFWVLGGIVLVLITLLALPGKVSRVIGFIVALSTLLVLWEGGKAFASSVNYKITLSQPSLDYSRYASIDEALQALAAGEVDAVIVDRRDLADLMAPFPDDKDVDAASLAYPGLRYLPDMDMSNTIGFFHIEPEMSGRLSVAVPATQASSIHSLNDLRGQSLATVAGEFADENYLAAPRSLVLVDLKVLNDLNLPHLQSIAEAFAQPARRNGARLMAALLTDAALYTLGEAVFGFLIGAVLGFLLGIIFAHSGLLERSMLPYVVASQTVPILAIAPMVVIWLGPSQVSVSIIAAYLTFFPVTINTLRGLQSPKPTEVELLQSYAASRWTILWKLRFPAALPYIFTALKVSATASVVGAIIGELPSGIGDGLGRAILNFSSDYSLISTPKLWASIMSAALVGILFFVVVNLFEQLFLGRYLSRS